MTRVSASTLNFLVWIDDDGRREWVLERAARFTEKHPSLMLVLDNTGAHAGREPVASASRQGELHDTMQSERIDVDVTELDAQAVVAFCTERYSPSVQTVLWWTGSNPRSSEAFEALLGIAGLLIVDSSGATGDDSALSRLIGFHRDRPQVVLRDLAWLRLGPWRDMIAHFFDNPELLNELFQIRKVAIVSGSTSEALYLAGWLASRLEWTPTGPGQLRDRDGKEISFSHRREGEMRRVHSICLDSETSWYHGEVTSDPDVVSIWVEGAHARDARLFPLHLLDTASLIERAILDEGADELFEIALKAVGTLLG
ncbi:MAG TPA: glucose-6-phosphate dehydrogenase assembly protein OpcA [Candidatus Elarobacter sp.]